MQAWQDGRRVFSAQEILENQKREFDKDAEERARELLVDDPPEYPDYVSFSQHSVDPLSAVGPEWEVDLLDLAGEIRNRK